MLLAHGLPSQFHRYTIDLTFRGESLDVAYVSDTLGIQPTDFSQFNNQPRPTPRERSLFWSYNGRGEDGFQEEWSTLGEGLSFLMRLLAPQRDKIKLLSQQDLVGFWWCGHFQDSFDGGPILTSDLMERLASFGLPLLIDNYFSSSEAN
jgi:hypothetical protein